MEIAHAWGWRATTLSARDSCGISRSCLKPGRHLSLGVIAMMAWPSCGQEPWDGRTSLAMGELSPQFIEVCWRVRCRTAARRLWCVYTTTQVRRCLPEIDNGDVGDPWIPVERATGGVLTVGPNGIDYRLLTRRCSLRVISNLRQLRLCGIPTAIRSSFWPPPLHEDREKPKDCTNAFWFCRVQFGSNLGG